MAWSHFTKIQSALRRLRLGEYKKNYLKRKNYLKSGTLKWKISDTSFKFLECGEQLAFYRAWELKLQLL